MPEIRGSQIKDGTIEGVDVKNGTLTFDDFNASITWKAPVSTSSNLPTTNNVEGDARIAKDTQKLHVWNGSSWSVSSNYTSSDFSTDFGNKTTDDLAEGTTNKYFYTHNHDDRYYTQTQIDSNYLSLSGGTITGNLSISGNLTINGRSISVHDTDKTDFGNIAWTSNNELYHFENAISAEFSSNDHYGFMSFRRNDGTRGGYIGYGDGGSYLNIYLDNASTLDVLGHLRVKNGNSNGVYYDSSHYLYLDSYYANNYMVIRSGGTFYLRPGDDGYYQWFNNTGMGTKGGIFGYATNIHPNLGDSSRYFNGLYYKTLNDVGCLGWFDDGVELQDGSIVSDIEAIKAIQKHPTKKTIYGSPMLDYSTFPKVSYKPAPIAEEDVYEDDPESLNSKHLIAQKGEKIGEDVVEMTSMLSIMLGALKELDARITALENN